MANRVNDLRFGVSCQELHKKFFIRSKSRQEKKSKGTQTTTVHYLNKPWERISFTWMKYNLEGSSYNYSRSIRNQPMTSVNIDNFPVSISTTRHSAMQKSLLSLQNFNSIKRTLSHLPINDQLRYENIICQVFSAIIHENVDNLPSVEEINQARELYNHNKTANKLIDLSFGSK